MKEMRSSLIYKYSCVQCTSEYIGSTTRLLASRLAEHSGRSLRTNRILSHTSHSNIREHAQTCGTPITIDNLPFWTHGILNLRQCMQHFEFWLRVRCLVARFFDVVQIKIIVSMIR